MEGMQIIGDNPPFISNKDVMLKKFPATSATMD